MKNLHKQLFAVLTGIFLCYMLVFILLQHYREESYKQQLGGVRVTLIDRAGDVVMDTEQEPSGLTNHLARPEVQQALQEGYGYDIRRTSETDGETYFYSATYFPETGQIIRSAVPYPSEKERGRPHTYLYIILSVVVFVLLSIVLYVYTRYVGRHVENTIDDYRTQVRQAEEEKMQLKHDLTQNTAHELKTPLASISGYLETVLSHPQLAEEQRTAFLSKCAAQTQRMTNLLNDMSTLTRLDNTQEQTIDKQTVDLVEIVGQAIQDVSPMLAQKQMQLTCELPDRLPIEGNYNLLYSVFRNILDNALLYSKGTNITIKGDSHYAFSIADNGVGVEAKHLARLFERFYRVDKGRSRAMGGTGLGLAIVKNALALHGGKCWAEPTHPHGLTIRLQF